MCYSSPCHISEEASNVAGDIEISFCFLKHKMHLIICLKNSLKCPRSTIPHIHNIVAYILAAKSGRRY